MFTQDEFCPQCRENRIMDISISRREVTDDSGNVQTLVTETFHCAICHTFVRSVEQPEEKEEVEEKINDSSSA
ncbi:MAG: hypothetical protein ACW98K_13955 [Candidatus Kariarchaeaceae archaeon]|jgi:hypothetical protein